MIFFLPFLCIFLRAFKIKTCGMLMLFLKLNIVKMQLALDQKNRMRWTWTTGRWEKLLFLLWLFHPGDFYVFIQIYILILSNKDSSLSCSELWVSDQETKFLFLQTPCRFIIIWPIATFLQFLHENKIYFFASTIGNLWEDFHKSKNNTWISFKFEKNTLNVHSFYRCQNPKK